MFLVSFAYKEFLHLKGTVVIGVVEPYASQGVLPIDNFVRDAKLCASRSADDSAHSATDDSHFDVVDEDRLTRVRKLHLLKHQPLA